MALAIFDLDDTLIDGDSSSLFLRYLVAHRLADAALLEREDALMRDYRAGRLRIDAYMAATLQPLAGRHQSEADGWIADFIATCIEPRRFAAGRTALARYRDAGYRCLIISASGDHLVQPIAAALGVTDALGIGVVRQDNRYTGAICGIPSYREGKVLRLAAWADAAGETLAGSHGYSDSINDRPLLEAVDHAHVVNPDVRLAQHARRRGWTRLNWQRTATR